jgi:hypothetical protein
MLGYNLATQFQLHLHGNHTAGISTMNDIRDIPLPLHLSNDILHSSETELFECFVPHLLRQYFTIGVEPAGKPRLC